MFTVHTGAETGNYSRAETGNYSRAETICGNMVYEKYIFFFESNLMYYDLWSLYLQVRELFKGGNYLRKYGMRFTSYLNSSYL